MDLRKSQGISKSFSVKNYTCLLGDLFDWARRREDGIVNLNRMSILRKVQIPASAPCVRATSCLIFEVIGPEELSASWHPGPLPLTLPDGGRANTEARSTYFGARAAGSIYGRSDRLAPCRWHRFVEDSVERVGVVIAVELLRIPHYSKNFPSGNPPDIFDSTLTRYLCIFHVNIRRKEPIGSLAVAVKLDPTGAESAMRRQRYADIVGSGFRVGTATRRAISIALVTFRNRPSKLRNSPTRWPTAVGWLWSLASATAFDEYCPDANDPHLLDGIVYLSSSWRGLVLRDGIGFLGLVPDSGSKTNFLAWGEAYVRSLYTDVVALASLQRDALESFASRLSSIGGRFEKSQEFRDLVNEVTEFRNILWWETVTRHEVANSILAKLHAAHRTPQLFAQVVSDLDAFGRQVEAHAFENSTRAQMSVERRSRRFDRAAAVAAISFALPALAYSALSVPIKGITSGDKSIPLSIIIVIGLGAFLAGAVAGAIGGRWLSGGDS
jgi:hypothetical protein